MRWQTIGSLAAFFCLAACLALPLCAAAAAPVVKPAVPSQEEQKRAQKDFREAYRSEIKEIKQPKTLERKLEVARKLIHKAGEIETIRPGSSSFGNGLPITWVIWIPRSRPSIAWPRHSRWMASS